MRAAAVNALNWEYVSPPPSEHEPSPFERLWLRGGGARPPLTEGYGQAKHAMDLLVAAAGRRLPYACVAACPGSIGTGLVPAAARAALPLLSAWRAYLPGFNIAPERGALAPLACALLPADGLRADVKYVTWAGQLVPATLGRGADALPVDSQDRMLAIVSEWLALWRRAAAAAAAAPR